MLTVPVDGKLTSVVAAPGTYELVMACDTEPTQRSVVFVAGTLAELSVVKLGCTGAPAGNDPALSGNVTGAIATSGYAQVNAGVSNATANPSSSYTYSLQAPAATHDLVVFESDAGNVITSRIVPQVDMTSVSMLDIAMGTAPPVATYTVTESGGAAGSSDTFFWAGSGTLVENRLGFDFTPPYTGWSPAASEVRAGDRILSSLSYFDALGGRRVNRVAPAGGDQAFTAPAGGLSAASATISGPSIATSTALTWAPVNGALAYTANVAINSIDLYWRFLITTARAGAAAPSFSTPDLTGISGWQPAWDITPTTRAPGGQFQALLLAPLGAGGLPPLGDALVMHLFNPVQFSSSGLLPPVASGDYIQLERFGSGT